MPPGTGDASSHPQPLSTPCRPHQSPPQQNPPQAGQGGTPDEGETVTRAESARGPQNLKPDLVIINEEKSEAYIVDVAVPFEGEESFPVARRAKEDKYNHLKDILRARGIRKTEVDGFVVGALLQKKPLPFLLSFLPIFSFRSYHRTSAKQTMAYHPVQPSLSAA